MKPLLYALTAVMLIGLLSGCTSADVDSTVTTATTEQTTPSTTEQTVPPTTDVVEVIKLEPENIIPKLWIANCDEYINLRPSPDGSGVLTRILPGQSMELLDWNGRYAKVVFEGKEGYVLSQYIRPADSNALSDLLSVVRPAAEYSYDQLNKDIAQLTAAYPNLCSTESISNSEEGRAIPVLRIGSLNAKRHILVQGSIHGREYMTAWLIMAMADFWLTNDITQYADVCYHLIPMTNPDGVTISQSGKLNDDQIAIYHHDRQTGSTTEDRKSYATHWKANALGTDLNRNFPSGWEYLHGVNAPSSQRYPGRQPFSAAETAALRDYTLRYTFDSTISYHAFGSIIYYEYGTRQPVNDQSYDLAKAVQAVTGYQPEGSSSVEGGGYKDWVMDALGIPSLTIEIGCQPTPLAERELYSIFYRNLWVLPTVAQWLTQ